jgi:hypothetical protein
MRRGFDGLVMLVQETLKRDRHCGHLFVFRGKRGGLVKILRHDGQGMWLPSRIPIDRPACANGYNAVTKNFIGSVPLPLQFRLFQLAICDHLAPWAERGSGLDDQAGLCNGVPTGS